MRIGELVSTTELEPGEGMDQVSGEPATASGTLPTPHPCLAEVFRAFEQAGIRWCLLRGAADLAASAGDVDLLIGPEDMHAVSQLLLKLGFAPLPVWGRGTHTFFLTYHRATDQWIKLDIVTELCYGPYFGYPTDAAQGCLARRERQGPVWLLAPDDGFWTLLLHCLIDKPAIAPRHQASLLALVPFAHEHSELARLVTALCPGGWSAAEVIACVRRNNWTALVDLGPKVVRAWTQRDPLHTRSRTHYNHGLRKLEHWLTLWHRRGLRVALLGPDGAGKSTLAQGVLRSFFYPGRTVYMGLWQRTGAADRPPRIPGGDLSGRLLKAWRGYLAGQYHRARGRLVLYDRYTYDALLSLARQTSWKSRLYFWILGHACPGPDLVLVLDAPGELMFQRKGEFDPEHLERQRRAFLNLQQQVANVEVVDVTREPDQIRIDVIDRIWRRYQARWRRH